MIAFARPDTLDELRRATLLVLDVDGVLLDARPSFHLAARETAHWAASRALGRDAGALPTDVDVQAFKQAGGWNDDFDLAAGLAWGVVLRELRHMPVDATARRSAGGLPTLLESVNALVAPELVARLKTPVVRDRAAARYAGRARCEELYGIDPAQHPDLPEDGLFAREARLSDALLLHGCGLELALFTGRNRAEAQLAVERFGLTIPDERRVVDDGVVPRKPAPDGLVKLAAHAHSGAMIFVGDSIDDEHAVVAYRELATRQALPTIFFARVLENDSPPSIAADVTVDGLDALLVALQEHR